MAAGLTTEIIELGGLRLRYRSLGQGPPVMVLHGWGGSIEAMEPVVRALSTSFRAISLDLPGHGQSSLPPEPWHVSDYLNCVMQFLDALGVERPHWLSHSFGGRITIKLAAEHPDRAGKVILTAAAGVPAKRTLRQSLRRRAGITAGHAQAMARRVPGAAPLVTRLNRILLDKLASRDYLNAGPLRETLIHVVSEDLTGWLPRISAPVLLVWGDHDRETPLSSGETMARLIPKSELVVLAGAGHFPFVEQGNKFNLHVMRFLRGEG